MFNTRGWSGQALNEDFTLKYNSDIVLAYYRDNGVSLVPEYQFDPQRQFRFDFAAVPEKVAIEVQGGIWKGKAGGHTSGSGYQRDIEKSNLGVLRGWRILQCVPQDICMSETLELVQRTLEVARTHMNEMPTISLEIGQSVLVAGSLLLMLQKYETEPNLESSKQQTINSARDILTKLLSALSTTTSEYKCPGSEEAIATALAIADEMAGLRSIAMEDVDGAFTVPEVETAYLN